MKTGRRRKRCENGAQRATWRRIWNYTWRHLPLATRRQGIIYRSSQRNWSHAGQKRENDREEWRRGKRDAEFSATKQNKNKNKERQVGADKDCWWESPFPFHDHAELSPWDGACSSVASRWVAPLVTTWVRFLVPLHLSHPMTHFRTSALMLNQETTVSYTYELFPWLGHLYVPDCFLFPEKCP